MNKISNMAGVFISGLNEGLETGGVKVGDLPKIINNSFGEEQGVNLFPSNTKGACHELAYFFALKNSPYAKGNGHLGCRQAMEKVIQHTQGACRNITKQAIFITAHWDANAYQDWKHILADIDKTIELEVYLLAGNSATRIDVSIYRS